MVIVMFLISVAPAASSCGVPAKKKAVESITDARPRLSADEKAAVFETIEAAIKSKYVFEDRTDAINASLKELYHSGKYVELAEHEAFATALTNDLVKITSDKHFAVVYNPDLIASRRARHDDAAEEQDSGETEAPPADDGAQIDWNRWYAVKDNFGFRRVEVLDGNIGYIKLNFFQPLDWVRTTIDSAMGFVANTNALIIDVTENQGGYRPTDAYFASYFFESRASEWISSFDRPSGETESTSMFEEVGGERYLNRPLYVLVSENTFSLAEQFAYGLKHFGRATIIGQKSAGAAHAIDIAELNENFFLQVPVTRSIHPVTRTDWEGVGVLPDIEAPASTVSIHAHITALDRLIASTTVDRMKEVYVEIRTNLAAPAAASTD